MKERTKLSKIASLIQTNFELEQIGFEVSEIADKEDFIRRIAIIVQQMIEGHFERFLSIMYRLDVSEKRLKEALNTPDPSKVYLKIAELIVEREEQKLIWRERYKS